jgi:hypothetical protein
MKTIRYSSEVEEGMQLFAATLNERDFRRYAAVEALKLEHAGIAYISELFSIDPKTISKGIKEIQKKTKL